MRRSFRDAEDWRALASVLVLHASSLQGSPKHRSKAAELCVQSYELWLERVKDREAAAAALARAVQLRPENVRAQERLRKLYESLGAFKELVALLRWRLSTTPATQAAAALHLELAELLQEQFLAIGEAVAHYEQALMLDPGNPDASERLIELYLRAGAWQRGSELMSGILDRLDPTHDRHRVAEIYRRLASVESQQMHNVAAAARYLQQALKVVPDDIDALQAFGVLYLTSGKANDDGVSKASDIFYKAAEIARRRGNKPRALKLLRRCLNLMPEHQQASAALENTLIDAEDWLALDDLYREWLYHFSGEEAVPLLLRRADLLLNHLHRREEARQLYEEASKHERTDGESWRRLEEIYNQGKDFHSLASLLDAQLERNPDDMPTETLARAASVYRDELGLEERAAVYFYKVLEREPFNAVAFEGYKEHWRRKHNWVHLRDLILYQIEQASAYPEEQTPLSEPAFAEEFAELADICERRLGDIDGALDAWGRLAAAYPGDNRPQKHIARIEKRARMWDNMVRVQEAELERAVDPAKRLDILKRLTQVYRDRQLNPERAIELYNEILELSPNDVQATRALTSLYDRAGDFPRVVEMLREQYERSRSNTERISLLRRMAEIWHHELDSPDEAIWACEEILAAAPNDREAMNRLQQILEEQEQFEALYDVLDRELRNAGSSDAKTKLLRRLAHLAEHDLGDDDRACTLWTELAALKPTLESSDKLVALLERSGRYEELGALLAKVSAAPQTPMVRQVDYLLRLGQLAESHVDDPELAKSSFESVLRSRPDHRGALEALVRLYRREDAWQSLVVLLGKLQELAETEEDAFRIAWERAELLGEHLDAPDQAAEVLENLSEGPAIGNREVASTLLELFERSEQHRKVIRQAEVVMLATDAPPERRRLYELISGTWREKLGDKQAALSAYTRYVDEFSGDLDALWNLSVLQLEVDDAEGALGTLARRLSLTTEVELRTGTLEAMAEIAEDRLADGARALEFLRQALEFDNFNEQITDDARETAARHGLWEHLLGVHGERFGYAGDVDNPELQTEISVEAAIVAEDKFGDPTRAFEWARRGYFVAIERGLPSTLLRERLERLAKTHALWDAMLRVIEDEIAHHEERGSISDGSYDAVARLLTASEIAEDHLDNPQRAVGFLQRAHRLSVRDEKLAERLEATARRYKLWQAVIELHGGRLERAVTDLGRFDACTAIAKIYEEELDDPEKSFEWLQKATNDLAASDPGLSGEAFDLLLALADRHALWPQLCAHHLTLADEARRTASDSARLVALEDATKVLHERMDDPMGALRVLASALPLDPAGQQVLPKIRSLSEEVDDKRSGDMPAIGALMLLGVLQRIAEQADLPDDRRSLNVERARVREERLDDLSGAMAEWMRVLTLDIEDDEALVELERIAEDGALWHKFLVLPGWQLERSSDAVERARIYKRLALLYEGPLERSEYALRSRLCAWRLSPTLPPREGDLDDDQTAIWRLAEQTGDYRTPPVPKDVYLTPSFELPEVRDLDLWRTCGLEPKLLDELPDPFKPKTELSLAPGAADAVPVGKTEAVSLTHLIEPTEAENTEEVVNLDDIEELEVDDLELISDAPNVPDAEGTIAAEAGSEDLDADQTRTAAVVLPKPPPPPKPVDAGLPELPRLTRPILPSRPKVGSAWEEVAFTYAEADSPDKSAKADVALVLARLWEEGAQDIERAFAAHERALIWVPEHEVALESLRSLADRYNEIDRLLRAYELLLSEAAMPEEMVAMGLRLAQLHEARDDVARAEHRYVGVLGVMPQHRDALRSLCRIYESQERYEDYVNAYAELLEAEHEELSEEERVERGLEIGRLLAEQLGRRRDAIEHLHVLVRTYPSARGGHDALIELLVETKQWQPAIEAMRVASDSVPSDDYRLENLSRVATLYEQRLGLQDRAIAAWAEIAESRDDPEALARLQELYLATSRFEDALPIIERRLVLLEDDDSATKESRISLLVAKARVLQEGLGNDEEATRTLEALVEEAPDNDEVALGLSRLYRRQGRLGDGIELLRQRWQQINPTEHDRFVAMTTSLTTILDEDGHDPKGALEVVNVALDEHPSDAELLALRAHFARALHDLPQLAAALGAMSDGDSMLEAAALYRGPLDDGAKAVRLYSRVLAEAKKDPDDADCARRLASSLEGLVKLRVEDGDIRGAMEFMDKQLAEMPRGTIQAQLLTEMGRITYRSTSDVDAAQERFDAALQEDPSYARAKLGKAEVLFHSGALGEAQALLTEAVDGLALSPQHEAELVEGLVLLADVLEDAGRAGEAYRRLTAAARHAPDNLGIRAAIVRNRFTAARFRDAITSADHVEQLLSEGVERTPQNVRMVSDIFVLAAQAELEMKQEDAAVTRYRRAAELDPGNPGALEPLISLCQERGWLLEAARHAGTLARQTEEPGLRGQRYVEAGMLFHDAASALADGAEPEGDETEAELRKAAFENLRLGLELVEGDDELLLEREQLEVAFRASSEHDPATALRCLQGLLLHTDLSVEHRHDLLLEGVRISLNADNALTEAESYARAARDLSPASSAAVLAQARVLEATDRVEEIEELVENYFDTLPKDEAGDAETETRIELLLRLAELQENHPVKAVAALEKAASLDPNALTAQDREHLASLYDAAGITGEQVLANHVQLLERYPLHTPSLAALANHHAERGDLDRAYALYRVLTLVDPDHEAAGWFLGAHQVVGEASEDFDFDGVALAIDENGGIADALRLLWDGGSSILSEALPKVDVPADARVSPLGDDLLSVSWGEALKRLGQSKVALVDDRGVSLDDGDAPDGAPDGGYFQVRWQHPPIIVALDRARESEDENELRFALARAVYFSRPDAVFAAGLKRISLATVLSATMQAFHPRHSRRKHHQKADSVVGKLSQELARKLPMKVSRQLTQVFKEHDEESFDSRSWRAGIRRAGNRVGLTLAGDIEAALRVVLPTESERTPDSLPEAVRSDEDLRDLIAFASSEQFVEARRRLAFAVAPRE